jgi:hypothetical protein
VARNAVQSVSVSVFHLLVLPSEVLDLREGRLSLVQPGWSGEIGSSGDSSSCDIGHSADTLMADAMMHR